ncbi:hypothetical protein [Solicola gregarius]|uniref:Uncharacterized protein n=1 Tax=Solicola gregarius TaxID=2908642 RepID=A0AA46TGM1_9ACTN|nr:hypothetical protein [Solicola gregarius]UYM04761.1 hypothetical protein L0C25_19825 [Solicola gregarius]
MSHFDRPALPGPELFETQPGEADPADRLEAGARVAALLVRGARDSDDQQIVDRVLHLADDEGLDSLAELWAGAPVDSLAGCLWRLYVLRTWVRREPEVAAREFTAGKQFAPVEEVIAGVVDPPGPVEVAELVDTLIRGVVGSDLATTLDRAAAFARLVGVGRAHLADDPPNSTLSAARLVETAQALQHAAKQERLGVLR